LPFLLRCPRLRVPGFRVVVGPAYVTLERRGWGCAASNAFV